MHHRVVYFRARGLQRFSPLPKHQPLGAEAGFGRVYDAAHLKKHPKQRVTAVDVFRDFTPDPNAEARNGSWDELIKIDGENGIRITACGRGVQSQRHIRILTSDYLPTFEDE